MALPDTEQAQKLVAEMFQNSLKPIWPNLINRQTSLEFIIKKQAEIESDFRSKIFPQEEGDPEFSKAVDAYYWDLI